MLFEDNAERQQKCINRVRLFPAESVAQACRELYVWCLMRKAKESENVRHSTLILYLHIVLIDTV